MSSLPAGGDAADVPSRAYGLVSATYQNKEYPEGILRINEAGNEIELSQWTGKKKKTETVIARFRLEPNANVLVDGALLRVSELAVILESTGAAKEVADLLRRPARELAVRLALRQLAEGEASVSRFLEAREEALNLLSRVRADPRGALLTADSTSTGDAEPLDALRSKHSAKVAESFEKMKSSMAEGEKSLGSSATERLYAITYAVGAVQNALFEGNSDLVQELAALLELGIATSAEELRLERPTGQLMVRAHPQLVALATSGS